MYLNIPQGTKQWIIHCNTLQHHVTHSKTLLQHTATHCIALQGMQTLSSQHTRRSGDIMGFFLTNWVWFTVLPLPPPSPLLARAPPPPPLSLLVPASLPSHRPPSLPDTREADLEAESFVWNGTNACAAWLRLVLSTDTAIVPLEPSATISPCNQLVPSTIRSMKKCCY